MTNAQHQLFCSASNLRLLGQLQRLDSLHAMCADTYAGTRAVDMSCGHVDCLEHVEAGEVLGRGIYKTLLGKIVASAASVLMLTSMGHDETLQTIGHLLLHESNVLAWGKQAYT